MERNAALPYQRAVLRGGRGAPAAACWWRTLCADDMWATPCAGPLPTDSLRRTRGACRLLGVLCRVVGCKNEGTCCKGREDRTPTQSRAAEQPARSNRHGGGRTLLCWCCILFYRIFRACNFSSASYQSKSYSTTSILFFFLIQKRPTINFEVFMRSGALSLACYGASRPEFESLLIKYGTGWLEFKLQSLSHVMSVTGG
jgi:hypothetical protein